MHVNRNVTMALNKVNCSLWVKVSFLSSAQPVKLFLCEPRLLSRFRLGRLFQVAKINMIQFRYLVYQKLLCLYNAFAFKIFSLNYSFAYIHWICIIPFAASCGLVIPVISWFGGINSSWIRGNVGSPLMGMRLSFNFSTEEKRRWSWRIRIR